MAISLKCDGCGAVMNVHDSMAGQRGKCPKCGATIEVPAAGAPAAEPPTEQPLLAPEAPAPPMQAAPAQPVTSTTSQHTLDTFSTPVLILLHFVSCGIFTAIWLNLMHGKMPKIRPDDPSAGKAIGFLFIPFFNLYWIFFTYHRLCLRINEQREAAGLQGKVPTGLATTMCVLMVLGVIPMVGVVTGLASFIIVAVFAGIVQSKVNELVQATRNG